MSISPTGRSLESTPSHFSLLSTCLHLSNEPSIRSSISPVLGLPCRFFPNIRPSSMSFNSPSLLSTCPTQFFLWHRSLIRYLLLFTIFSISSLFTLSLQPSLSIFSIITFLLLLVCRFQLFALSISHIHTNH